MIKMANSGELFPNPGKELQIFREKSERERQIVADVQKYGLAFGRKINCTCHCGDDLSYLGSGPPTKGLQSYLGTGPGIVHASSCKANSNKLARQGDSTASNSNCSIMSMKNNSKSNDSDSDADLGEFFDPLKSENRNFVVYKIDLEIKHPQGYKCSYNSILEFIEPASSMTVPGQLMELCINPNGKVIKVEKGVMDQVYRMVWGFANDEESHLVMERIRTKEMTPRQFTARYGSKMCFRKSFAQATWNQFERVLPDWSYPTQFTSKSRRVSCSYYYITNASYRYEQSLSLSKKD